MAIAKLSPQLLAGDAARHDQISEHEIDVEPERYKHYLVDELPEVFKPLLDTRACGTGERIVFEPSTREMYERTHRWMAERQLFAGAADLAPRYDEAVHLRQSER